MGEIAFEHAFDDARRILCLHVTINLAAEGRVRTETAADVHVIAFDLLLAIFDLAGKQSDVADVVLRTGMMAAGKMDVDRSVERDARLAPLRDVLGVTLGVGG